MHRAPSRMDEEGIGRTYRRQLAENFFYKFFLHVALAVDPDQVDPAQCRRRREHRDRPLSSGTQEYTEYPELYPADQADHQAGRVRAGHRRGPVHAGPSPAGRRPARGDGQELAAARPLPFTGKADTLDALQELLRRQYPDFQAFITVGRHPGGGHEPDRPGRATIRCSATAWSPRWAPHRAGGRGDHRHGAGGGGVHRGGVHRLRGPARRPDARRGDRAEHRDAHDPQGQGPRRGHPAADSRASLAPAATWTGSAIRSRDRRHRGGDRVASGPMPRPTSTSRPCAPWPSLACTTR